MRLYIYAVIYGGRLLCGCPPPVFWVHIVEAVNSNQSAVSHQLRILKDNNIVKSKRDGQSIVYSLTDEHIMQIISLVKIHVEE